MTHAMISKLGLIYISLECQYTIRLLRAWSGQKNGDTKNGCLNTSDLINDPKLGLMWLSYDPLPHLSAMSVLAYLAMEVP